MERGFTHKVTDVVDRLFPERQLLHRSRGHVRFLSLSKNTQIGIAATVFAFSGWFAFATASWLNGDRIIAAKNQRIAQIEGEYGELATLMETHQDQVMSVARELEQNNRQIISLLEQKSLLEQRLSALSEESETLRSSRDATEQARAVAGKRLSQVEGALNGAVGRATTLESSLSRTTAELAAVTAERDHAIDQARQLGLKLAELEVGMRGASGDRERLSKRLAEAVKRVDQLTNERDSALKGSRDLSDRVASLEKRIAEMRLTQRRVIARVEDGTRDTVEDMELVIGLTWLSADRLLGHARPAGQGGPFVGLGEAGRDVKNDAAKVEVALGRWSELQDLIRRLPLASPVDDYTVESGFGRRIDPFTKRWAVHAGVDLSVPGSRSKADIIAPAAGIVTFAGFSGPYGRLVEIDHGNGIVSRYAHLSRIAVHVGQRLERRHTLGQMGSSGRSTGTHLHYEVLHNGVALDPMRFLEAGKYVFKN